MAAHGDKVARAYARLVGLRESLPKPAHVIAERFVDEYHEALQHLSDLGIDVAEFRLRLEEYFDRGLTRAALLSRLALSVDFNNGEPQAPGELDDWPGRVLIVESNDDPATPAVERRRLREAYPRALVCAFAGAGEMIPLLRLEELVGVVKAFLKEEYNSPSDIVAECVGAEEHAHAPHL